MVRSESSTGPGCSSLVGLTEAFQTLNCYSLLVAVELPTRRFTVEEYHRMGEAEILTDDDRVELIEGEVVEMSPIGAHHARCVDRLTALLVPAVQGRAIVRVQGPVRIPPRFEPQPDLALLRWRDDFYPEPVGPGDVLLVIEVAETSVGGDRRRKIPLYAAAGIPEVWLVDLPAGLIDVYRDPGPLGYALRRPIRRGERVAPEALADVAIEVAVILG